MASFNRVIIVGNLTRDVELRYTQQGGTPVTDIGVAVNDRVKRGEEWIDEPTFVEVTLWGKTAEVAAEYLRRGSPLLVEGRLKQETWHDKNSGEKRTRLKVVCDRLQMLGRGNNATTAEQATDVDNSDESALTSSQEVVGTGTADGNIPF